MAPDRGFAFYNAPNSSRTTDELCRDSDTASITSSLFHSEAQVSEMRSRFQQVHRLARGYKEKNKQVGCLILHSLMSYNKTDVIRIVYCGVFLLLVDRW